MKLQTLEVKNILTVLQQCLIYPWTVYCHHTKETWLLHNLSALEWRSNVYV